MDSPMAISHISTSPCKFCIAKTNSTTNIESRGRCRSLSCYIVRKSIKLVLEKSFHSSATFYSAESKLVLISKYIKTIDQVFRGSKNNNHKSHTYRLFDSIIFNTFFYQARKVSGNVDVC
jgi:hypothetical protein